METRKFKIIASLVCLGAIIIFFIVRHKIVYNSLKDSNVTIGITTKSVNSSDHSYFEYIYEVGNKDYKGQSSPLSKLENIDIQIPNGKYYVLYNEKDPSINVMILDTTNINNYEYGKSYDTIQFDKKKIRSSIRNGTKRAKLLHTTR
jgi:hypothetical protein